MKLPVLFFLTLILCAPAAEAAEALRLELGGGRSLEATLRVVGAPKSPSARLPAVMLFGGFENAARVLELVKPTHAVVLASFDYPFKPPRKFRFPESFRHAPEAKRMIQETIGGILELRRALSARPEVDPARITVVGASLGAPFATAAAALDPGIRNVVVVHGFGRIPETAMRRIASSWSPKLRDRFGVWGERAAPGLARLMAGFGAWYLEPPPPEASARMLRPGQRALMITAKEDSFIPRESTESLWNAMAASEAETKRMDLPGDHLQPGSDRLIDDILARVQAWMADQRK